jgi:hypothetical protein
MFCELQITGRDKVVKLRKYEQLHKLSVYFLTFRILFPRVRCTGCKLLYDLLMYVPDPFINV